MLILQTLPPIVLGLWRTGMHRWALLAGWAVGIGSGLFMLYDTPNLNTGKEHFGGPQYALSHFGFDTKMAVYTGIIALVLNLLVTGVLTLILRAVGAPHGEDSTAPEDYEAERGDPGVDELPASAEQDDDDAARAPGGRFGRTGDRPGSEIEN